MPADEELSPEMLPKGVRMHRDGEFLVDNLAAKDIRRVAKAIGADLKVIAFAGVSMPDDLRLVDSADVSTSDRLQRRADPVTELMNFRLAAATDEVDWHTIQPGDLELATRVLAPTVLGAYADRPELHKKRMEAEGRRQTKLGAAAVKASAPVRKWLGELSPTGYSARRLVEMGSKIDWDAAHDIIDMKRKIGDKTSQFVPDAKLTPEGLMEHDEDDCGNSAQPPILTY